MEYSFPQQAYKINTVNLVRINLPLFSTVVPAKGKLILTEIFPSVQKHDIFLVKLIYVVITNSSLRLISFKVRRAQNTRDMKIGNFMLVDHLPQSNKYGLITNMT